MASLLSQHQGAVMRLAGVPGLGVDSAQQIIAEVGPTAATFPSAKALSSWVGACPGDEESAASTTATALRQKRTARMLRQLRNLGDRIELPNPQLLNPAKRSDFRGCALFSSASFLSFTSFAAFSIAYVFVIAFLRNCVDYRPMSAPRSSANINLLERIDQLNKKRQEIIRPILEHPRDYVLLSVRALAARLQSDPATIVRIVHGLGFESYRQFQHHLHELSLAYATSLDTMKSSPAASDSDSPVRDSLLRDLKNLQALKNTLDPQRFIPLSKRIYSARRIVILGGDLATIIADFLGYHLNVLGLPVWVASTPGSITHTIRFLTAKDLLVAISFRRGIRQTIEGTEQARRRDAYCVGITDTYMSPLAQHSHELFLASIDSVYFGASYTAPIALCNAMLTAIGEFRRSRTLAIVRELDEEQRTGSRWYAKPPQTSD